MAYLVDFGNRQILTTFMCTTELLLGHFLQICLMVFQGYTNSVVQKLQIFIFFQNRLNCHSADYTQTQMESETFQAHAVSASFSIQRIKILKINTILWRCIITVRKRSLRRLCFYRCLCVVALGGMCGCSGGCMVAPGVHGCSGGHVWLLGGHAWLLWGACMVALGGMHGCSWGVCVVVLGGGHAWLLPGGHV